MSKYVIGLDLGINNVGWAVYDLNQSTILDKGVVRYQESSNAQDRRSIRGSRRLNKRKHHRVERLAELLFSIKFNTKRTYEPELLEKRIKGLSNELTEQEITNIIYYFAIHRGYIPFDDEKPDRETYKCKDDEFPCTYLKKFYDTYNKYRGQANLILMTDNMKELREILVCQSKYNDKINKNIIDRIIEIITSKREFWEGPGNHYENQLSPYGRYRSKEDLIKFEKDPTYHKYLYEMLIGKCSISIDKLGNVDLVAPRGNYFAEKFNFLNDFINMSIKDISILDDEYKNNIDAKTKKIKKEIIEEIEQYILDAKTVDFKKIIAQFLGTTIENVQGYRVDKNRKPEISKFEIFKFIKKQFETSNLKPSWLISDDKTIYNKIIYILTVSPSVYSIPDMLKERLPEIDFTEEEINILKEIKKKKNSDLDYHSLSESILIRALSDLEKYDYQFNYMQIMKKLEYEKEMKEYFQENYSRQTTSPYYIDDSNVDNIIANPQVKKTIRKAIKVINAIIKQQGEYPDSIIIESAKEMNGKKEKLRIESEQRVFESLRKEAENILLNNGFEVNEKNIDKVIYWLEAKQGCIYCGKPVPLKDVIKTDFEHILPKSKTMDNSSNNVTCSCEDCNTKKNNRTPYEFLTSQNLYDTFKNKILKEFTKLPEKKIENLLFEGNIEKYSLKFINRNLRDTAYGTTALIEELNRYNLYLSNKEGYTINIISSPGQLTSRIRKNLNLSKKNRDYLYHHAIDAMILASICDTPMGHVLIQSQNNPKYWTKIKGEKQYYIIWDMLEKLTLKNANQIKQFNIDCDNQPEDDKEGLLKRSYEILRNPIRQFADTNYSKFIKIDQEYYQIKQISNIYNCIIRDNKGKDEKDKKLLDKLFDVNNKEVMLLCEKNDTKLFNKLKEIYLSYNKSINPFVDYCVYKYGLEQGNMKFEYLINGITKTEKDKSPIVVKLRYIERVTNPYIKKEINLKKKNKFQEFTNNQMKEKTIIGLTTMRQVCTRIFYSINKKKYLFLPICAISFKNGKLDENDQFYIETYNRILGNEKVIKISDIYCGEWIGAIDKNGEYVEGRFSYYHKISKGLVVNINGLQSNQKQFAPSKSHFIIYTIDILGNRYVRLDTRKLL